MRIMSQGVAVDSASPGFSFYSCLTGWNVSSTKTNY